MSQFLAVYRMAARLGDRTHPSGTAAADPTAPTLHDPHERTSAPSAAGSTPGSAVHHMPPTEQVVHPDAV